MVTLADGPAMTTAMNPLQLKRVPRYLRAVVGMDGKRDALDQLDDTIDLGEVVHVYAIVDVSHQAGFACGRGSGGSFSWGTATYRHLPDVDAQALGLDDTDTWQAWTMTLPDDPREALP